MQLDAQLDDRTIKTYAISLSHTLGFAMDKVNPEFRSVFGKSANTLIQNYTNHARTVKQKDMDITSLIYELCNSFYVLLAENLGKKYNAINTHNLIAGWSKTFMVNAYVRDHKFVVVLDVIPNSTFYSDNFGKHWLAARPRYELFINAIH